MTGKASLKSPGNTADSDSETETAEGRKRVCSERMLSNHPINFITGNGSSMFAGTKYTNKKGIVVNEVVYQGQEPASLAEDAATKARDPAYQSNTCFRY